MKKNIFVTISQSMVHKLKPLLFIITLGFFSLGALANPKLASKQQIGMFKNSTTCVVLENGIVSYNTYIKDAVEKHWKYTDFEFIDQQEFQKRRFDSKYSFLVLMKGVYEKDPGGVGYNYISLVLGDKAMDITDMPEICSIPFAYSGDNETYFGYAIPAIVKFMQKHAVNLETKRFLIALKGLKYYNGQIILKNKVLLLNKNQMAPDANTAEKIKTVYPYYFKLLSPEKIKTELDTDPINTMFNFHVGPTKETGSGKCFEMIFDVEGNLYYYNYRMVTNENKDGLNLKDLRYIR
ncbi:MAG: hypothetical protein PWP52_2094 [Bacteroidales bacterium]|nr:hypothetical protein [Bacteroidales bacterium]